MKQNFLVQYHISVCIVIMFELTLRLFLYLYKLLASLKKITSKLQHSTFFSFQKETFFSFKNTFFDMAVTTMRQKQESVGIIALDCHFPKQFVSQTSLEEYDMQTNKNIRKGKYTIGLGQNEMSFCGDREDIYSIALTCLDNLINKYEIPKRQIGRITVSTETVIDHSKSIKSVLMQLFEDEQHFDVEGVDMIHACYSGTAALLDALNWCYSPYWDGKYAIVLAADIAEYAKGNARMTGGAGCVGMLIGENGIIKLTPKDGQCKSSHSTNAYDFYKADLTTPYPIVNGKISNKCYLNKLYANKHRKIVCFLFFPCVSLDSNHRYQSFSLFYFFLFLHDIRVSHVIM